MNKEDYELIIEMLAKKVNKLQQTKHALQKEVDELTKVFEEELYLV